MSYKAFISYSHAADSKLAPALQSALERFAKPWYRVRNFRIFRDQTNLSAAPQLWPKIAEALDQSEFFLLMASTRGAGSRWVGKEVEHWCKTRGAEKFLVVLTEGAIAWDDQGNDFLWDLTTALPRALRGAFASEPLYIDFTGFGKADLSLSGPDFLDRVATVAATLHGKSKDEISGEHIRQHRRTMRLAWSAAGVLVVLLIAALVSARLALVERDEATQIANVALQRQLSAQSQATLARHPERGLLLAAESVRAAQDAGRPIEPAAATALYQALAKTGGVSLLRAGRPILRFAVAPDASRLVAWEGSKKPPTLWRVDRPGSPAVPLAPAPESLESLAFHPGGRHVAGLDPSGGEGWLWDLDRPGEPARSLSHPSLRLGKILFLPDGRRLVALAGAAAGAPSPSGRFAVLAWDLDHPGDPSAVADLDEHGEALLLDPDGRSLVAIATRAARGKGSPPAARHPGPSGLVGSVTVRSWDVDRLDAPPSALGPFPGVYRAAALEPGGRRVAVQVGPTVHVGDLARPEAPAITFDGDETATLLAFHSGRRRLVAAGHVLRLGERLPTARSRSWDLDSASKPPTMHPGVVDADVINMAFQPDGGRLAVPVYESSNAQMLVRSVALVDLAEPEGPSPAGRTSASPPDPGPPITLRGHEGHITHLEFHRDRRHLYTSDDLGVIRLWDINPPESGPLILRGHPNSNMIEAINRYRRQSPEFKTFAAVATDGSGRWVATASHQGGLQVWDLQRARSDPTASRPPKRGDTFQVLAFEPGGLGLVAAGSRVIRWEFGRPDATPGELHGSGIADDARLLATDGPRLAAVERPAPTGKSPECRLKVWDLGRLSEPPAIVPLGPSMPMHLALHPDGRRAILAGHGPPDPATNRPTPWLRVLGFAASGSSTTELKAPGGLPEVIAVSPGGRWLVTFGWWDRDGSRVAEMLRYDLDAPSADPVPLELTEDMRSTLAFHPDGRRLFTTDSDGTLFEFDLRAPRGGRRTVLELDGETRHLVFRPDGLLASAQQDGTVLLTDLERGGGQSIVLGGHVGKLEGLLYRPDGGRLVTAGSDSTVRVWDLDVDALLRLAADRAGRNLSPVEWRHSFPDREYRKTFDQFPAP